MDSWEIVCDALECKQPARVPSICIIMDYDFMQQLHHSLLAFTYEEFQDTVRRGIQWFPFHVAGSIKLGFNLCWSTNSVTKLFWADDFGEPALFTNGLFKLTTTVPAFSLADGSTPRPHPHFWHAKEAFNVHTSKDRIQELIADVPKISNKPYVKYRRISDECEKHYNVVLAGGLNAIWEPLSLCLGFALVSKLWRQDRPLLHAIRDYLQELAVRGMAHMVRYGKPKVVIVGDDD